MSEITKLYPNVMLPENYWNCRLSEIPDNCSDKNYFKVPYKKVLEDWVLNFKDKIGGKGIHFYGPYGTGKSGAASIILKAGVHYGYLGLWMNFQMIQEYSTRRDKYMYSDSCTMLDRALQTELLYIDEVVLKDNKQWSLSVLEDIVRIRHQNSLTTLLSSNSSPLDFSKYNLTKGLASILSEATFALHIDGKKFRPV